MLESGQTYVVAYRTVINKPEWASTTAELEYRGIDGDFAVFIDPDVWNQKARPVRLAAWQLVSIEVAPEAPEVDNTEATAGWVDFMRGAKEATRG